MTNTDDFTNLGVKIADYRRLVSHKKRKGCAMYFIVSQALDALEEKEKRDLKEKK